MNRVLFPRDTVDLLVPGLLWYFCVWVVLCFVVTGMALWHTGVCVYRLVASFSDTR